MFDTCKSVKSHPAVSVARHTFCFLHKALDQLTGVPSAVSHRHLHTPLLNPDMVQLEASAILVSAGESQLPYRSSLASVKTTDMEFVEVFDSPGKGRGLRAIKEVWAGDVLFAEPPFASVVFDR